MPSTLTATVASAVDEARLRTARGRARATRRRVRPGPARRRALRTVRRLPA